MLYDYKSEQGVQDVVVKDISAIIEDVKTECSILRYGEYIAIYAPYQIIYDIADSLCLGDDNSKFFLDEESDAIDGLPCDVDTLLSINSDGSVMVENARGDNGSFKKSFSTMCYVYDGYTKDEIEQLYLTESIMLIFGFEEDLYNDDNGSDDNCGDDDLSMFDKEDINGLHGFQFYRNESNGSRCSYSFYTTDEISTDVIKDIARILR